MQHSSTPCPLTEGLARFVADTPDVPAQALAAARSGITDAIGLMIAAAEEPVVQSALRHVRVGQPQGSCSVLLTRERARARDAAFVNAVAAHAFAMDDVAWGCHPSAVLLPTILAVGEQVAASGADVLRAWVVGYEVIAELARREPGSLHTTGWHPTGLIAPVATAAAACHLLRLPAATVQRALGIAASFTGGLSVNFGTQTKALHAGRVAAAGVEATELAMLEVTSTPTALENANGLLHTISPGKQVDLASPFDPVRPPWRAASAGISVKKYPLCYSVHRIADAGIDVGSRPGFDPSRVRRIDIEIGTRQAAMAHHRQPQTPLQAKYSVEFAVVSGLLSRSAGFAQLVPEFYESAEVRRLIEATQVHRIDDVSTDDAVFAPTDRVRVTLDDGTVLDSGEVRFARGHAMLPIAPEQLRQKFLDCAAPRADVAQRLFDMLQGLDQVQDIHEVVQLASGG